MPVGEQRIFWKNDNMRCILFKTKDGLEVRLLNDRNLVIMMRTATDAADALRIANKWRVAHLSPT
jgi:hypothetical protein